ncbi:Aste57867_21681 [Aphanomyces stellatus]|uniref:Aste57867_21681 protein n=1 Tax=Aphanomyces stellatus TaxID=120398 RepID=A0A485LJD8_9STRA|nr:hypothetical protein As57867_021612 [Aphanomyces stellatus]VFT98350.1 Aste57867_21681 [Aphanomyces stellatus]
MGRCRIIFKRKSPNNPWGYSRAPSPSINNTDKHTILQLSKSHFRMMTITVSIPNPFVRKFALNLEILGYSGLSQQTAYTSEDMYSQSQTMVSASYSQISQDEQPIPLSSLLQSRYSRMLMESESKEPKHQLERPQDDAQENSDFSGHIRDSQLERQSLGSSVQAMLREKQKEMDEKLTKTNAKKRKLEALAEEKKQRRDAKEMQRQKEQLEKLERRKVKQEIETQKEAERQARKLEKRRQREELENSKAMRKEEKRLHLELEKEEEMKERKKQEELKAARRQNKDKAAAKRELEFKALQTRILKLEHQLTAESKDMSTMSAHVLALTKTTKDLLAENKKLVKVVQDHKRMVSDGTSRLKVSIGAVRDTISETTDALQQTAREWISRDIKMQHPTATTPPVNRALAIEACASIQTAVSAVDMFAIVEPTTALKAESSSDENDPLAYGSTFAFDMIQNARDKRRRKQQKLGRA